MGSDSSGTSVADAMALKIRNAPDVPMIAWNHHGQPTRERASASPPPMYFDS